MGLNAYINSFDSANEDQLLQNSFMLETPYMMGQTVIKVLFIIAVMLMINIFPAQICNAQRPINPVCNNVNYTGGSKFESNLNTVLNNLVQHTARTGFNTSVHGQTPDRIYGLLQCRGDGTVDQCYNCSQQVSTTIRPNCGNAIGGRIWSDFCYLRYENYSFFGQPDTLGYYISNKHKVTSPDVFNAALESLLTNLSAEATSLSKLYASGTIIDSLFREIYGLVQCWRDISIDDCKTCLSNTINYIFAAYSGSGGAQGLKGSCIVRYEIYSFFNSNVSVNTTPKLITPSKKSSNKIPITLGGVGGFVVLLLACLFATRRSWKFSIFGRECEENAGPGAQVNVEDTVISQDRQVIVYRMETLIVATDNFHDNNKLGEGGFGAVYKGTTQDGQEIAVKKLSIKSMQGKKEFLNEIKLVANIQHRNLVKLLGYCSGGSDTLLVYEYLPNKSLDKILFDPNKRKHFDWEKRHNIILGVARGLLYLHHDSQVRIIHRDIKASNILLDDKLNPKIADFGLAKLFSDDESHVNTRVAGTYGYMAPEYAMQGRLSVKADVYSFGVLLLELITGRKNTDYNLPPEMQILLGWAWRSYKRGNTVQVIDRTIIEACHQEQALRCIHVGLLCVQADSSLRPTMSTVTSMLSTDSVMTLPDPAKPVFVTSVTQNIASTSYSATSYSPQAPPSIADVSISELVPR